MKVEEIEQEALALPAKGRAYLAAKLLHTLPTLADGLSDAELTRREDELDTGATSPISHDEFVRRVQHNRGK